MKPQILICLLLPLGAIFGSVKNPEDTLLPAKLRGMERAFGYLEAHAMADAQRVALYGDCGMCVYKEQRGPVWVFQTRIGYAGTPGADISVITPEKKLPRFDAALPIANKSVESTPTAVTPAAGAPGAPSAGVPHH